MSTKAAWFEMPKGRFDMENLILCEKVLLDFTLKKTLCGRKSMLYVNNSSLNLYGCNVSKKQSCILTVETGRVRNRGFIKTINVVSSLNISQLHWK